MNQLQYVFGVVAKQQGVFFNIVIFFMHSASYSFHFCSLFFSCGESVVTTNSQSLIQIRVQHQNVIMAVCSIMNTEQDTDKSKVELSCSGVL